MWVIKPSKGKAMKYTCAEKFDLASSILYRSVFIQYKYMMQSTRSWGFARGRDALENHLIRTYFLSVLVTINVAIIRIHTGLGKPEKKFLY